MSADVINPMIAPDGDTLLVSSSIDALAGMLEKLDTGRGVTFDSAQIFGLVLILQTASAALRHMNEIKH